MKDVNLQQTITLIDVKDFLKKYPRFSDLVNGKGYVLFDAIIQPEVFIAASILADHGYPSVLAVAEKSQKIIGATQTLEADNFTKQFIGSVVCALMEANGYKKTGIKKSVPHELFTSGEFYEKDLKISGLDSVQRCGSARLANLKPIDTEVRVSWKKEQTIEGSR